MRVLFVSQYFPPETGAAPARALHFARALVRAGHEVRVVTGLPNHPSSVILPAYARTRRATEMVDGVTVERVWLHATPRKTAFTRLWNHLTFAWSALPVALGGPRPDVVFATVPPLFLGVTAWVAARRHRAAFVLDVRDDWPTAAIALGELRPGPVASAIAWLAHALQRRAARVVAVTPSKARAYASRGVDAGRLEVIANGADTERFTPAPPRPRAAAITVLYAGTHGLMHGMDVLLDAAERLRDRADIRFLLVGDGVAKAALVARAEAAGLRHVEFRPSVPPDELVRLLHAADVCVATMVAHPVGEEIVPVKVYDYLACGVPVVATVSGEAAAVVEASGGGIVVPPGDGVALAGALVALLEDPARRAALAARGPAFIERAFSRRAQGDRLAKLLATALRAARGRGIVPQPDGPGAAGKRVVDLTVAVTLLVLLAPVLVLIAVAIRLDSPGPALFRQRRIGRGTSEFVIVKFRTMRVGTPDLASHLVGPLSPRVTRLGRFLRRTSLDELPQLFNVLCGEMSLVGPRPALHNQDDLIAMRQESDIDALKPGVTGWAQVNGRDDIPLERKVAFDRWYLEHVSPATDALILARTAITLFSSRGTY